MAVGAGVAVGGTEVAVGGTDVAVGGTGVAVGGIGVAVGGAGVAVGGTAVAVGGTGVDVGAVVAVGSGDVHASTNIAAAITPARAHAPYAFFFIRFLRLGFAKRRDKSKFKFVR